MICLLLLLLGGMPVYADPLRGDESDWLKTMAVAAHQTDYSGVFIYQAGEVVEMSRITHVTDEKGEYERLESLVGMRRELIRNNDQVWLYCEGRETPVEKRRIRRTFPALLPEQMEMVKANYLIRAEGEEEIAGHHAHGVLFQPRDTLRYTRKMWAHYDTGLLLKAAVMDEHGHIIEQHTFTQLNIGGDIDRKWIARPASAETASTPPVHLTRPDAIQMENSGWRVDDLPDGFRKIVEMRRSFRGHQEPVIHLVFSDGLAGISVFIEKAGALHHRSLGLLARGAVNVYGRVVGDMLVTVVGEVPARTVIRVAESVRYAGE